MKRQSIVLSYKDHDIQFRPDGWINATLVASRYGKLPSEWLRLPDTEKYIAALMNYLNAGKSLIMKRSDVVATERGRYGGTWLHPKLAVAFARWLDVDFAVWCDMQIESLRFGGGYAMRQLEAATKDLEIQDAKGSNAGRNLAAHRYAKPPLVAQVEHWKREVQLTLGLTVDK